MEASASKTPTNKLATLRNQAQVRVLICCFMGWYFLLAGLPNHFIYIVFAIYSVLALLVTYQTNHASPALMVTCIFFDNGFAILGLAATGHTGTFLLFFLIHISFGYGIRFGNLYLAISLCIACFGIMWLYISDSDWGGDLHFLISFVLGIPFISLYVAYLTSRIRKSEAATKNSERNLRRIFSFLAHDIRTPLAAISSSIEVEQMNSHFIDRGSAMRLERIKSAAHLLAKITDDFLDTVVFTGPSLAKTKKKLIEVHSWLLERAEIFRDSIEINEGLLVCEFLAPIKIFSAHDLSLIDRILFNALSNASRYCHKGFVRISVRAGNAGDSLIILIENKFLIANLQASSLVPHSASESVFHGASIGLEAAREMASSIDGSFTFQQVDVTTFRSTIEFPIEFVESSDISPNQLRAILVQRDKIPHSRIDFNWEKSSGAIIKYRSNDEFFRMDMTDDVADVVIFDMRGSNASVQDAGVTEMKIGFSATPIYLHDATCNLTTVEFSPFGAKIFCAGSELDASWLCAIARAWVKIYTESTRPNILINSLLEGIDVLLVDDNLLTIDVVSEQLRCAGAQVTTATDFAQAEAILKARSFALVISDWHVRNRTFAAFLEEAGRRLGIEKSTLIILTGEPKAAQTSKVLSNHGVIILPKPLSYADLISISKELRVDDCVDLRGISDSAKIVKVVWDAQLFRELLEQGTTRSHICKMLRQFSEDIRDSVLHLSAMLDDKSCSAAEAERLRHRLAGECQIVGAHSLADGILGLVLDGSCDSAVRSKQMSDLSALMTATLNHVHNFMKEVEEYRSCDVGPEKYDRKN